MSIEKMMSDFVPISSNMLQLTATCYSGVDVSEGKQKTNTHHKGNHQSHLTNTGNMYLMTD